MILAVSVSVYPDLKFKITFEERASLPQIADLFQTTCTVVLLCRTDRLSLLCMKSIENIGRKVADLANADGHHQFIKTVSNCRDKIIPLLFFHVKYSYN